MDGYRFGPARIDVESDDPDAARWLREFLIPWFEACPPGAGDFRVRLTVSAPAFDALARRQAAATPRAARLLRPRQPDLPSCPAGRTPRAACSRRPSAAASTGWRPGGVEIVARTASPARAGRADAGGARDRRPGPARPGRLPRPARRGLRREGSRRPAGRAEARREDDAARERPRLRARGPGGERPRLRRDPPRPRPRLRRTDPGVDPTRHPGAFPALRSSIPGGSALLHAAEIEAAAAADPARPRPSKYSLSPAQLAQQLGAGTVPPR